MVFLVTKKFKKKMIDRLQQGQTHYLPEVLGRLNQQSDDTKEKVKVRLWQFHANVEVARGGYIEIAVEVDGTQRLEEVGDDNENGYANFIV